MNHRAKNLLAVVQAVALQTARHCQPDQFSKKFDNRLRSLSASHDLLVNSKWHSVNIRDLVLSQLSHFDDLINDRIVCSDTKAKLNSNAAQAIGLALHELITNAAKYGALSTSDGTISITWAIEGSATEPRFKIQWQEKGGPPVTKPIRQGFGHSVLLQMAPYSLGATVDLSFPPEGLKWHLDAPAALVLKPGPHAAG